MKFASTNPHTWDQYLDAVTFSYRCSIQQTTKHSPFELMYGAKPLLPDDLRMKVMDDEWTGDVNGDELTRRFHVISAIVSGQRDEAQRNIAQAQSRQKQQYDLKHRGPIYKVVNLIN